MRPPPFLHHDVIAQPISLPPPPASRRAFTIVEALVVTGIIAVILALVAPALRGARSVAHRTVELSAARQLMVGYANYAAVNRDAVLPGYADAPRAIDQRGMPIAGGNLDVAARRYLWRIAPFIKYNIDALYVNDMSEVLERLRQESYAEYLYAASIAPSLGLNSEWIGGDLNAYGFLPTDHPLRQALDFNRFYLTRLTQAQFPDRLMTFASARGVDPESATMGGNGITVEGYFKVFSPMFTELTNGRWSADAYSPSMPAENWGHVSARYRGQAVIAFIDGHTGGLTIDDLRDMRHWANWADRADWRLPRLR